MSHAARFRTVRLTLGKLEKTIAAAELAVIVSALAVMLGSVCWNVVSRTFALPWRELSEPALVAMSVLAFIGSSYAVYSGNHIVVDLDDLIPAARWRRRTGRLIDAAVLAFSMLILYFGLDFLTYVLRVDERTAMLDIPLAMPVGCLLGGAVLSIFHIGCRFARVIGDAAVPRKAEARHVAGERPA